MNGLAYYKLTQYEKEMLRKSGFREKDVVDNKAYAVINKQNVVSVYRKKNKSEPGYTRRVDFIKGTDRIVG